MKLAFDHITMHNADKVILSVQKGLTGSDSVLDFSTVSKVDTAAFAVIFEAKRLAKKQNKELDLVNLPAQLDGFVKAYGVQSLL